MSTHTKHGYFQACTKGVGVKRVQLGARAEAKTVVWAKRKKSLTSDELVAFLR